MKSIEEQAVILYALENCEIKPFPGHPGGRNRILICCRNGEKKYILRISELGDRTGEDYLAETEFVHYLARNGAPVADVIPSVHGRMVECVEKDGQKIYLSLFAYAKGMLLGVIHRLSREFKPVHRRPEFFDKYNRDYIERLIPDSYAELKDAINRRLDEYGKLPMDAGNYGLIHFDFCDGNYHVDMNTGDITVFDFDNCIYCWYMFDLAHVWTHGIGWFRHEPDPKKRMAYMKWYFDTVLEGYRSETDVSEEMLEKLPLFIDMTLIESIVDEFECCAREEEEPEEEDIGEAAECLIHDIPYAGFGAE